MVAGRAQWHRTKFQRQVGYAPLNRRARFLVNARYAHHKTVALNYFFHGEIRQAARHNA